MERSQLLDIWHETTCHGPSSLSSFVLLALGNVFRHSPINCIIGYKFITRSWLVRSRSDSDSDSDSESESDSRQPNGEQKIRELIE